MSLFKGKHKGGHQEEGGDSARNLGVAYSMKKKANKMADGGMAGSHQSPGMGHTINIHVTPMAEPGPHRGEYASGGEVGVNKHEYGAKEGSKKQMGTSEAGFQTREMGKANTEKYKHESKHRARMSHLGTLQEMRSMDKPKLQGLAEGGSVACGTCGDMNCMAHDGASEDEDMVGRIMKKRSGYSKGGEVANEDSGESASDPDMMAKDKPNEFDDLALDDDLSFNETGANSGDEDGSELNQEDDDEDMVGRIMKKRAKG